MARPQPAHDPEVVALYRLPVEEFVTAREALVRRRRGEGRKAEAAAVHALAKPTPAATAVNLLFAREPEQLARLIAAGAAARKAQDSVLKGRGRSSLQDSVETVRQLIAELRHRAVELLEAVGRSAPHPLRERIAGNLQALAFGVDAEAAERGWLARDLTPPGFEVVAGLQLAGAAAALPVVRPAKLAPAPSKPKQAAPRPVAVVDPQRERLRDRARAAITKASAIVDTRAGEAERMRSEAEKLSGEAVRLERAAVEARRRAAVAERAAEQAARRVDEAQEALALAQGELRRLG